MKKIRLYFLVLVMLIISISSFGFIANAEESEPTTEPTTEEISTSEGETVSTSEEITESEEISTESEIVLESGKEPLKPEDIKDGLDGVMTDNQKAVVEKLTAILSKYINIAPTILYCIIGGGVVICVFIFVLIAKNSNKKVQINKLVEQNKAVVSMAKTSEERVKELSTAFDKLSTDGFQKMLAERNEELEKTLLNKLKLDSDTIGELISKSTLSIAYMERIIEAFKIMASKSNNTALLNELSTAPTSAEFKKVEYENQKLKSALGEEAVKKILEE
jgi:hypothetical protein